MGDPKKTPEVPTPPVPPVAPQPPAVLELTAAEAAKAVKREVPALDKEGKPTGETKLVSLKVEEVHAWALRGQRVIVVTTDGQKLEGSL